MQFLYIKSESEHLTLTIVILTYSEQQGVTWNTSYGHNQQSGGVECDLFLGLVEFSKDVWMRFLPVSFGGVNPLYKCVIGRNIRHVNQKQRKLNSNR